MSVCNVWQLFFSFQNIFVGTLSVAAVVICAWIMLPLISIGSMRVHPSSFSFSCLTSSYIHTSHRLSTNILHTSKLCYSPLNILLPTSGWGRSIHAGLALHYKIALTIWDRSKLYQIHPSEERSPSHVTSKIILRNDDENKYSHAEESWRPCQRMRKSIWNAQNSVRTSDNWAQEFT